MGQKTDARIFRQGVNKKNWELKHIEKNNEESSLYLYKTLEIQKYLNRFFELYKMKIHNCKIFYSDGSLHVFVSFYLTTKTISVINKNLIKYSKKLSSRTKRASSKKKKRKYKKRKKILFKTPSKKIKIKIKKVQKIKDKKGSSFDKTNPYLMVNLRGFQEVLLESLVMYTRNKINISVTLQNLNCYKQLSRTQMKNWKVVFKQLKKFVRKSFFKEAVNTLFVTISKRKSAKLLADFISQQFRLNQLRTDQATISRKDNYFLGFLKQTVMLLVKSQAACLTGIKITIKGRFNRAPRARTVKIHFGKFSLQSFDSKVDYYQSTAYTINGTFGVKVWLCENNY
jgi:hypothetical protein